MSKTNIEWVRNPDGSQGYTWNPITGCLNHINGLCKGGGFPCYAYKLANGRLKQRYLANTNVYFTEHNLNIHARAKIDPFYPRFWEERLYEPVNKIRRWGRQTQVVHTQEPKGIFVCDMGDLFGIGIPEEWTRKVLDRFQYCPRHRLYLLTKQPQNLIKFSPFPENAWVGVTCADFNSIYYATPYIAQLKAKVKFVSFEPLLESMAGDCLKIIVEVADWLIIGACTGTYKDMLRLSTRYPELTIMRLENGVYSLQPRIEWVREIVEAADKAGIKVFLKDNLMPLFKRGDIWAIPEWAGFNDWSKQEIGTTLRQEMP